MIRQHIFLWMSIVNHNPVCPWSNLALQVVVTLILMEARSNQIIRGYTRCQLFGLSLDHKYTIITLFLPKTCTQLQLVDFICSQLIHSQA